MGGSEEVGGVCGKGAGEVGWDKGTGRVGGGKGISSVLFFVCHYYEDSYREEGMHLPNVKMQALRMVTFFSAMET